MPFQDVDEIATPDPTPAAPSRAEQLLRRIFLEDWSLKLLSLAIAVVLWLLVTGQNEPVTAHVNVQLNFIRPQSLEISNDPPRSVDVMLTGSRSKLDDLSSLDLVATVDISDQRAGERGPAALPAGEAAGVVVLLLAGVGFEVEEHRWQSDVMNVLVPAVPDHVRTGGRARPWAR